MHKIAKRAFVPVLALVFILGTMSAAFAASSSGSMGMPDSLAAQVDQGSIAAALRLPEGSQREEDATVAVVVTPPTTPTTVTTPTTPTTVTTVTPTAVAGQQTTPTTPTALAGVTSLPSTATDNAASIALLAAGLAALAAGLVLRSRLAR